jgi:hypothetical protein
VTEDPRLVHLRDQAEAALGELHDSYGAEAARLRQEVEAGRLGRDEAVEQLAEAFSIPRSDAALALWWG